MISLERKNKEIRSGSRGFSVPAPQPWVAGIDLTENRDRVFVKLVKMCEDVLKINERKSEGDEAERPRLTETTYSESGGFGGGYLVPVPGIMRYT